MENIEERKRFAYKCTYSVGRKEVTETVIGFDMNEAQSKFNKYAPSDMDKLTIIKGRELRG